MPGQLPLAAPEGAVDGVVVDVLPEAGVVVDVLGVVVDVLPESGVVVDVLPESGVVVDVLLLSELEDPELDELEPSLVCACATIAVPPIIAPARPTDTRPLRIHFCIGHHLLSRVVEAL
jgi:hypothetical protein